MVESTRSLLEFACDAVRQAGNITLVHFQKGVAVERKADRSPVTIADRSAEALLRQLIEARFPTHAIVGEEMGATEKESSHRWWIDPIDGTQSFIRGVPLYGVMLGLEIRGELVLGAIYFPALDDLVAAAAGEGCHWNGQPANVSSVARLDEATVCYSDARDLVRLRSAVWARVQSATAVQRGWSDCYGHCLVATGRAEIMLDPIMNPWDCAALVPILREAGGTFTDWDGRENIHAGSAVSTNGALLEPLMNILRHT